MANPITYPAVATDNGTVIASCQITAGAAGAVASVQRSRELKATPVSHPGTGRYVFAFKELWQHLEYVGANIVQATYAAAGARKCELVINNIKVDGTVEVNFRKATDDSLVDLATGDIVKAFFALQKIDPAQ